LRGRASERWVNAQLIYRDESWVFSWAGITPSWFFAKDGAEVEQFATTLDQLTHEKSHSKPRAETEYRRSVRFQKLVFDWLTFWCQNRRSIFERNNFFIQFFESFNDHSSWCSLILTGNLFDESTSPNSRLDVHHHVQVTH
jgi:hypothetical protein